jgi:HPt (histidine-containing phosphotransfer) domain-containing protein
MHSRSARHSDACVLDISKLARLEALMGPAKFLATLEKFKHELDLRVSLIAAKGADDAEKVRNAHKLVGTSGLMGLLELCEACQRLENAAAMGGSVDLQPHIDSVMAAAQRARRELELLQPIA